MNKKLKWITEYFTPYEKHSHAIKRIVVSKKTKFQKAVIADTYVFGRALFLDDEIQSAIEDEYIYHEALVHPAMILVKEPKDVLILGGGEGATLREVYKVKGVRNVTMVDIDGELLSFCYKYLKEWHKGSFDDKRTKIVIDDGRRFIFSTSYLYDIIISDLPTPIKGGPAYLLYTIQFYRKLKERIKKNGVFVLQAGSGAIHEIKFHHCLYYTLKKLFKFVTPYYVYVPSFDVTWAFLIANDKYDASKISSKMINDYIRKRIKGKLKFYDPESHTHMFSIPLNIRKILSKKGRVITDSHPIFSMKK